MRVFLLLLLSLPAFADIDFFEEPLAEIPAFLKLPAKGEQTWIGLKKTGGPCRLTITRTDSALVFSPDLPDAPKAGEVPTDLRQAVAFVVTNENKHVNGGTEGNHLWSSYFIDDESSTMFPHPHGQFGMSFRLDLKLDGKGGFREFEFSKGYAQDLGYESLGRLECHRLVRAP